ncbi:helix-turn-helix domain-containing protein [Kribbella qitaiheensis]|uniref:Helix-turn-helix domain-containing protein n=1 Tax=Kribbella qitaiheensis TaxID=1544730 RepID=A0A7G6WYN1_9ACTN|nr:AlkA N-terminal domain-containing protein [Kribbella qitaiheensis]QNE19096.1 helix-turn-helix domain-containing protein [Kribbella qitaiheensis]
MTTYSAVRTTGIYCRPGCGAKPLAENVRTFELAAAAEAEGYRACLRCRPYRVAGTVADDAPELVCRAVQLIIAGVLDDADEVALGAQLGMSARHLRRLFNDHLGVTPDQFARSRRAHFARRLLDDSELTIADVAFASGFGSLRQFNRAMREVFRATPRELRDRRRRTDRLAADGGLVLRMPFTPPYDWDAMAGFLARNAVPGVESVQGGVYRRTIALDGALGLLEIGPGGVDHLLLKAHLPYWEGAIHVVERAGCLVGLTTEPVLAAAQLAADPVIGPLIEARPGIRVPGAWGPFEVAVQAVVTHHPALTRPSPGERPHAGSSQGDRPALTEAREVLARVVEVAGTQVDGLGFGLTHAFPSAESVAEADLSGIPGEVARTIKALAHEVALGNLSLAACAPLEELTGALLAIDGVSEEAAQWVALRLGARDASPITKGAREPDEAWRPWRALAAMHLEAAAPR